MISNLLKSKKLIKFIPVTKEAELASFEPKPSKNFIPEWYKKIPKFTHNETKLKFPLNRNTHNSTLKKCIPFLDGMTAGYTVVLDDDVYIEQINQEPFIRWKSEIDIITWHNKEQYPNFSIPENYHYMVAKWHNDFLIKTPKGFSVLFTHPLNRLDLPFFTLSGLVDCDKYNSPIHFPFLLKRGFEGIIESGTPIAQIVPVKRELWKSKKYLFNSDKIYQNQRTFLRTFSDYYKKKVWIKKNYE